MQRRQRHFESKSDQYLLSGIHETHSNEIAARLLL